MSRERLRGFSIFYAAMAVGMLLAIPVLHATPDPDIFDGGKAPNEPQSKYSLKKVLKEVRTQSSNSQNQNAASGAQGSSGGGQQGGGRHGRPPPQQAPMDRRSDP